MNIPDSIWEAAEKIGGFDWEATGGGVDYVSRVIGTNKDKSSRLALLAARNDAGSPDNLRKEKARIVITLDRDWRDTVTVDVANALEGLKAMATMETVRSG